MKARPASTVVSPYLDAAGAIRYLVLDAHKSPRSALQRLIDQHHLPFLRRGHQLLFDTRELDVWLRRTRGGALSLLEEAS